jgi:signal transduction histidine kinase
MPYRHRLAVNDAGNADLVPFAGLLDTLSVGVAVFDRRLACRYLNAWMAARTGAPFGSFRGRALDDVLHAGLGPDVAVRVSDQCTATFRSGASASMRADLPGTTNDSPATHTELCTHRLHDSSDRVWGLALACYDAEPRRRLDAAEQARQEAERTRRALEVTLLRRRQFLGALSHELRAPLAAVSGYAQMLELGTHGPVNDGQRAVFARMRNVGTYALHLVEQIAEHARLEAHSLPIAAHAVRIADVLSSVEAVVQPLIDAKTIHYVRQLSDPTITVLADADRLAQVLVNLVANAVKFTDAGGRIFVACSATDEAVTVDVSDNGRGIERADLERVFEPFVQSGAAAGSGVGLGLAISRELARAMGGDIAVRSTRGAGSTFTVRLPRVPAARRAGT